MQHELAQADQRQLNGAQVDGGSLMQHKSAKAAQVGDGSMQKNKSANAAQ
jgi:hypothetical protein